jgi:hypothetical protein
MSDEDDPRKHVVAEIVRLREHCRALHINSTIWARRLNRKHEPFLIFIPWALALLFLLNLPFLTKLFIYIGALAVIDLGRRGIIIYLRRKQLKEEIETDAKYETQVFEYLQKHYGANFDGLKYLMRPCNIYSFTDGKVKEEYDSYFNQSKEAVSNHIISTPDISNVIYFGPLNLHGAKVENVVVQLMPDQTIALLKDGIEIPLDKG